MSRFDLVIFGATGFTGKHVTSKMVNYAQKYGVTWAVAGRSERKLQELMVEVSQMTGADVSNVKLIVADVKDEVSLNAMCAQCKVLVNCCGPYRFYGEPVVKAAITSRTHYVDITGEPEFMEQMQLKYNMEAKDAGVYVISACGWDSIPADMGVMFLLQNFAGTVNSVESYMSFSAPQLSPEERARGLINYGTWESLVYGLANQHRLKPVREKLYPTRKPIVTPKLHRRPLHRRRGEWYLPFLGADESVVFRSQRALHERDGARPAQFRAYFAAGSLARALLLLLAGALLYAMARGGWTRALLLRHPRLFSAGLASRAGPSAAATAGSRFRFELVARGWREGAERRAPPDETVVAQVNGTNPGYGATVVALLMSAITILKEKAKMPVTGGVYTPGVAFKDTDLVKHLNENDLTFEIINTD